MVGASDRLDLKLLSDDKQLLIQAATIEGMTLAAFVHSATKEHASEAILRDFAAIHELFSPHPHCKKPCSGLAPRCGVLEEHLLDPRHHNCKAFRCGVDVLDSFLVQQAGQNHRRGFGETFVLVEDLDPARILGEYSLAPVQVARAALQPVDAAPLPPYPVPCFRMARLARDRSCRGQGIGSLLFAPAVERFQEVRQSIGGYALLVDAKDEPAAQFYEHHGFRRLQDTP